MGVLAELSGVGIERNLSKLAGRDALVTARSANANRLDGKGLTGQCRRPVGFGYPVN